MRFQLPAAGIWSTCVFFLFANAPAARGATINVPAGGNLQTALNTANPGDVITLQPGATYTGNFMLPNKGAISDYITVRSAAADSQLPPAGVRMTPASASLLPRIKSPNSTSVLRAAAAANHWKLMFLEFQANANGYGDIIALGAGDSTQTQLSQVPYALVLDRVYVHGDPLLGQKRGISLQSKDTTIVNSWVSDCKAVGQDSQAISGWNGPGPYLIENNYLEGATENFLLGGADATIANLVPANITFRRNYLSKPLAWRDAIVPAPAGVSASAAPGSGSLAAGTYFYTVVARRAAGQGNKAVSAPSIEVGATLPAGSSGGVTISWTPVVGADDYLVYGRTAGGENMYWLTTSAYFADSGAAGTSGTPVKATKWAVKNIFELKNAQDVLVEGNVFENLWVADQPGFPIVFTPRNQYGNTPWVVVQRVTFRHNIVRHTAGGVNIMGIDNLAPSQLTNNVAIYSNVFDDLTGATWGTGSRPFQIGNGGDAITIDHNTVITTDTSIVWLYGGAATSPTPITNVRITNNMSAHNSYGIDGSSYQPGNSSITAYMPGAIVTANVLAGGMASRYPAGNFFPTVAAWQGGFANYAAGDYHLSASSPYKRAAGDGSDLGADINEILAETANALSGDDSVAPNTARVRIITTTLPDGTLDEPYAQLVSCSGGSGACAWRVNESLLPAGVSFDAVAGLIVGVPAKIETGSIALDAYDVNYPTNSTSATLTLTIDPPPFVVSMPAAVSTRVGDAFEIVPTASGALGTVTWTVSSGDLPAGVTLDALSGRIAGIPSTWGTTTALVEARDSWRADRADAKPLTVTVEPTPLAVATAALTNGVYGAMYRADVQATGGTGTTSWSLASGTLPSGLTLDAHGTVSGVPQSIGTATITVQAVDANWPGNAATASLSITIDPPALSLTMPPSPAARVGQPYELTPTASGNVGTVSWSITSGSLPEGLTLDPATGSIAGTPARWGTTTVLIRATDSWASDRVADQPLTIGVAPVALSITGTLAAGTYQVPYAGLLRASGGTGTVTWSIVSGALPNGFTLDAASGAIAGTPIEIGTFTFAVMAADAGWAGETATETVGLAVVPPPFSVVVPPSTTGQVGTPYTALAVASGQVGAAVWSLASGSLPPGVTLNASTGIIAGVPSAFGTFTAVVQAQDSWSASRVASGAMTLTVAPSPLVIAAGTLPPAAYRARYQAVLAASGGTGLTEWSVSGGSLPPGLTLSPAGAISGAPTAVGTFTFTARAVDAGWAGNAAAQEFSITVGAREVVLYATDATTIAGTWALVSDTTGAGAVRIANPDKGAAKLNTPLAAPANYFDIPFAAEAGVAYHLWIRGKAENNYWGNDSVMVQFSNSVDATGAAKYRIGTTSGQDVNLEDCSGCGISGWGWQDNGWGVNVMGPAIYFDRAGPATIRVQVKEDGFSIDQIVLSAGKYVSTSPGALKNDTTILSR
jgi:putative Ig domain-containing protein